MPRKLNPATQKDLSCVRCVVDDLRNMRHEAVRNRDFLRNLGSPKAALAMQNVVEAIRRAIKVTEGAARHMSRRVNASEQVCQGQVEDQASAISANSELDYDPGPEGTRQWWKSPLLHTEVPHRKPVYYEDPSTVIDLGLCTLGTVAIDLGDD